MFIFVCLFVFGLEEENQGVFHHSGGSVASDVLTWKPEYLSEKHTFFFLRRRGGNKMCCLSILKLPRGGHTLMQYL